MDDIAKDIPPGPPLEIAVSLAEDPSDGRPARRARLANALLPGAGLIGQDRLMAGVALGLAFWVPLAGACYGSWIAPLVIPRQTVLGLTLIALAFYVAGQVVLSRVLGRRARRIREYAGKVGPLLASAYRDAARGDLVGAQVHIDETLAFDAENMEARLLKARVLAFARKSEQSRQAYGACRRLDAAGRWEWEISREEKLVR